jgi:hypothetical protein
MVHHLRKTQAGAGSDDWFEKVSGSMGITGACDAVMVLSGKRGEETTTLNITSRDFDPAELVLSFKGGFWQLRSTDSEAYRKEQEYLQSPVVRGVVALMAGKSRWEGTATKLLYALCEIHGIDIKPEALGKALIKVRSHLLEREAINVTVKLSHKCRMIILIKGEEIIF